MNRGNRPRGADEIKVVAVIGGAILVTVGSAAVTSAAALRTISVLAGASVTASPVVSGNTTAALSEAVSKLVAPTSNVVVYAAPAGNGLALTVAATNAAAVGGIVLEVPASLDVVAFKATLSQWPITTVRLVGPASSFPSAFKTALAVSYPVDSRRTGTNVLS